jgi:hypothetical protein
MKVSKLKEAGKAYRVNGQVAVFVTTEKVAATTHAAICYTEDDGYYDVIKAKFNYVRGNDVKSWVKTKGRSNLSWEKAVKEYNKLNEKGK